MTASGQTERKEGKWEYVVSLIPAELKTWDFRPALRTLFYRLFDKHAISNIGSSYHQLGKNGSLVVQRYPVPPPKETPSTVTCPPILLLASAGV